MDLRLEMAAQCGDMDTLYTLIQEDPFLLERIDQVPFVDTPLHIAASAGHTHFAMEIMRLKPSYARKPNQQGFSPIHLALQNGHSQLVLRFIEVDGDLVRVQGREGITPLHFVAEEGNVHHLAEFLAVCPKSIQDLTIRKETAVHIAVKNNNMEALKVLLGWLERVDKDVVLKWTDDEGNTILYKSLSMNQFKMVRLLITRVDINTKNLQGLTALDILKEQSRSEDELKIILLRAGAIKGSSLGSVPTLSDSLKKKMSWHERMVTYHYRKKMNISNEDRNVILLVATLIAAANYQAFFSSYIDEYPSKSRNINLTNTNVTLISPSPQPDLHHASFLSVVHGYLKILITDEIFYVFSVIAFVASMIEIFLHLPDGTVLHLVLAILIYATVVVTSKSMLLPVGSCVMLLFLFCGYWSKFSVVVHKLNPMITYKRSMKVKNFLFKHYCSSFHRELSA